MRKLLACGDEAVLPHGSPAPTGRAAPPAPTPRVIDIETTHVDFEHQVRAVDRRGELLATAFANGSSVLWASGDEGSSWQRRGALDDGDFRCLSVLPDGTMVAGVSTATSNRLSRSDDDGASWHDVLELGPYRMLQPHNIVQLGGTVFFGEYQTFGRVAPIHLWASTDDGRSWTVRHELEHRRHVHGLVADEQRGALRALLGDSTGGILRSDDGGRTFTEVLASADGGGFRAAARDRALRWAGRLPPIDTASDSRSRFLLGPGAPFPTASSGRCPG